MKSIGKEILLLLAASILLATIHHSFFKNGLLKSPPGPVEVRPK
jgi:hypothetical protein